MAELLDAYGSPMDQAVPMPLVDPFAGMPAVIVPEPWSLQNQSETDLNKLRDESMDKVKMWESNMGPVFEEQNDFAMNWRVQPRNPHASKPRGFANSKSGETHKAVESLATIGFRMLTASDNFYQCVSEGVDEYGNQVPETELYAVESLIKKQLRKLGFKPELLKCYRSLKLFGTVIFELIWDRQLNPDGQTYFEGTRMQLRSLIQTGFDTNAVDISMSDYIFTVDFPTVWKLKQWSRSDPETWDRSVIERETSKTEYLEAGNMPKTQTNVLQRIIERRQRAGYNFLDKNIRELIQYHGRLDTENSVIASYWESLGLQSDPSNYDFTMGILDGENVCRFHVTQYGNWRTKLKSLSFKQFELEPIGYGVGKIAKRTQKELDVLQSRTNDGVTMGVYFMMKLGRYAGLKPNQLNIKPWGIVELDQIDQLEKLSPDFNAIVQALQIMSVLREELRNNTGASANLQAISTKATATESSLTQSEAIRGVSVHAEIEAEVFIREFLEQCHINNLDNLDSEIWVNVTGEDKPRKLNRFSLPRNVGFEIKVTTDKDFRPERIQKILEGIQVGTSVRNIVPETINMVRPLIEEYYRDLGINPRLLYQKIPVQDQIVNAIRRNQAQAPQLPGGDESAAEAMGDPSGGGSNISTPMGDIPTSPVSTDLIQGI